MQREGDAKAVRPAERSQHPTKIAAKREHELHAGLARPGLGAQLVRGEKLSAQVAQKRGVLARERILNTVLRCRVEQVPDRRANPVPNDKQPPVRCPAVHEYGPDKETRPQARETDDFVPLTARVVSQPVEATRTPRPPQRTTVAPENELPALIEQGHFSGAARAAWMDAQLSAVVHAQRQPEQGWLGQTLVLSKVASLGVDREFRPIDKLDLHGPAHTNPHAAARPPDVLRHAPDLCGPLALRSESTTAQAKRSEIDPSVVPLRTADDDQRQGLLAAGPGGNRRAKKDAP